MGTEIHTTCTSMHNTISTWPHIISNHFQLANLLSPPIIPSPICPPISYSPAHSPLYSILLPLPLHLPTAPPPPPHPSPSPQAPLLQWQLRVYHMHQVVGDVIEVLHRVDENPNNFLKRNKRELEKGQHWHGQYRRGMKASCKPLWWCVWEGRTGNKDAKSKECGGEKGTRTRSSDGHTVKEKQKKLDDKLKAVSKDRLVKKVAVHGWRERNTQKMIWWLSINSPS